MNIEDILNWPSLAHELALEQKLFGASSNRVKNWLQQQLNFIHDKDFARLFSDNIDCFDVEPSAYNHCLIETTDGSLLGGIRFYGLDIQRPFVEVVAHNFSDFDRLCKTVKDEWAIFGPQSLRLTAPAHSLPTKDAALDVSIHGAQYAQMYKSSSQLALSRNVDIGEIDGLVQARYKRVKYDQLKLGRNISATDRSTLADCHDRGDLYIANIAGNQKPIGMIAVYDGPVGWLQGDVVQEEVVVFEFAGNGYGAQMQMELASIRQTHSPDRLLLGTIDVHNHASRKSAERAGRPEIMRRVFLPL